MYSPGTAMPYVDASELRRLVSATLDELVIPDDGDPIRG
jgi:hypothetical protein